MAGDCHTTSASAGACHTSSFVVLLAGDLLHPVLAVCECISRSLKMANCMHQP